MLIWILCSTYFCSWKVIYCSVERIFISTGRYELGSLLKHIKPSRVWTSTSINICDQLNIYNLLCEHHYLLWLFYIILLHGCSTCFCKMNFHSISYLLKLSTSVERNVTYLGRNRLNCSVFRQMFSVTIYLRLLSMGTTLEKEMQRSRKESDIYRIQVLCYTKNNINKNVHSA